MDSITAAMASQREPSYRARPSFIDFTTTSSAHLSRQTKWFSAVIKLRAATLAPVLQRTRDFSLSAPQQAQLEMNCTYKTLKTQKANWSPLLGILITTTM